VQDLVTAEVVQAHAQLRSAAARLGEAEGEVRRAVESARKNFEGLSQTRPGAGDLLVLAVRPQEAVAALQALAQAYSDYYGAVADYNRAQFRLYRALGTPAQALADRGPPCEPAPAEPASLPPAVLGPPSAFPPMPVP
jgi:hypothetical protein